MLCYSPAYTTNTRRFYAPKSVPRARVLALARSMLCTTALACPPGPFSPARRPTVDGAHCAIFPGHPPLSHRRRPRFQSVGPRATERACAAADLAGVVGIRSPSWLHVSPGRCAVKRRPSIESPSVGRSVRTARGGRNGDNGDRSAVRPLIND